MGGLALRQYCNSPSPSCADVKVWFLPWSFAQRYLLAVGFQRFLLLAMHGALCFGESFLILFFFTRSGAPQAGRRAGCQNVAALRFQNASICGRRLSAPVSPGFFLKDSHPFCLLPHARRAIPLPGVLIF